LTPIGLLGLGEPNIAVLFYVLTIPLWITHRANISRLLNGQEGKIGAKG